MSAPPSATALPSPLNILLMAVLPALAVVELCLLDTFMLLLLSVPRGLSLRGSSRSRLRRRVLETLLTVVLVLVQCRRGGRCTSRSEHVNFYLANRWIGILCRNFGRCSSSSV